jgi:hypothetical protein
VESYGAYTPPTPYGVIQGSTRHVRFAVFITMAAEDDEKKSFGRF